MEGPVELTFEGRIAVLTLARPAALNAFDTGLIRAFRLALREAEGAGARALLLTGTGRAFCAGADLMDPLLTDYGDDKSAGSLRVMREWIEPLVLDLAALPLPTVAAVNGLAAGGGIGLALAADIVVAARSALFLNVFVPRLGLVPDMGVTWHLARALGPARARAIAMLGEPIAAAEAAACGLIWKAVDDVALMPEALAVAQRLAEGPPLALARIRKLVDEALNGGLEQQVRRESETQALLNATDDAGEGLAAFRQKRPPVFGGS